MDQFVEHTSSEESDEYDSSITIEREAALYSSVYHSCDAYIANDHKEQDCMHLVNTASVRTRYFNKVPNKSRWNDGNKNNNNGNYIRNFVSVDLDYRGDSLKKKSQMQTNVNASIGNKKGSFINKSSTEYSVGCFAQEHAEGVCMPSEMESACPEKTKQEKDCNNVETVCSSVESTIEIETKEENQKPYHGTCSKKTRRQILSSKVDHDSTDVILEMINHVSDRIEQKRSTEKYKEVLIISDSEEDDSIVEVPVTPKPEPPLLSLDSSDEATPVPVVSTKPLINDVPHSDPKVIITSNVKASKSFTAQEHDNSSLNNSVTSVHNNSKSFKKNKRKRKIKSMVQFYNKSWGGETFDHIKIQKNMSNNPQLWQILDVDKYGPPHTQRLRVRCRNCMQIGHMEKDCTDPKKIICCFMCGQRGHGEYRCPFKICLKCGRPASCFNSGCQSCWSRDHPVNCGTCGDKEHFSWMCPSIWRKFHAVTSSEELTNTQLQVQILKPPRELCCCFCAGHGHTATHCPVLSQTRPNILVNSPRPMYPRGMKRKRKTGSFNKSDEYEFYRKRRKNN